MLLLSCPFTNGGKKGNLFCLYMEGPESVLTELLRGLNGLIGIKSLRMVPDLGKHYISVVFVNLFSLVKLSCLLAQDALFWGRNGPYYKVLM